MTSYSRETMGTLTSEETMKTLTAEEAATNLQKLMALAYQEGHQFRITSEEGSVVLLSEETYQNLIVTLELLATPGLMSGVRLLDPHSPAFS